MKARLQQYWTVALKWAPVASALLTWFIVLGGIFGGGGSGGG